jgi:hypothetical protein
MVDSKIITWSSTHDEILRHVSGGKSPAVIASLVGKTLGAVKKIIGSEEFSARLKEIDTAVTSTIIEQRLSGLNTDEVKEARMAINKAAIEATHTVIEISRNGEPEDRVRLDAAKDILDRVGIVAPQVIKTQTETRQYAPEEVAHARKILEESEEIAVRLSGTANRFVIRDNAALSGE